MVLTIARKLVLSFLGLTLVVLVATLGLARWSFERGFMDYANALEQERLQMLTVSLAQQYQLAGGTWDDLTERAFQNLLHNRWPDRPGLGRRLQVCLEQPLEDEDIQPRSRPAMLSHRRWIARSSIAAEGSRSPRDSPQGPWGRPHCRRRRTTSPATSPAKYSTAVP